MKFNVSSRSLYTFVAAVNKVINSKNALAILNSFLFILKDGKLQIVACDMENTLVGNLDVIITQGEGRFCIDAARIIELLKEIPEQGIEFNVNDDTLGVEIKYSSGTFNLMAVSASEYPYDPDKAAINEEVTARFTMSAEAMLCGIDSTVFAASHDELRPQMNGIYWDIHEADITFVATDTKQLARYIDRNIRPGVNTAFTLPSKPCAVVKNIFTKEGDVTVTIYDKCVVFENEQFNFTCTYLKGRFPDYNRVIPRESAYTLTVAREEFIRALRRVSVFSGGQGLVKFKITPDQIRMRTDDSGVGGGAYEVVPCEFTGSELLIGFSFKFLIDMFSVLDSEEGIIKLSDPSRPGLIVPSENAEGTELTMLLMPMSVGEFKD